MNIVLITTDQQRADTLGVEGSPLGATPHLDALAAQGTRYAAARTQNPLCQPSRASILTGTYPSTHGVTCNGVDLPFDAEERSVATLLEQRGLPHRVHRQGALCDDVPVPSDGTRRIRRGIGARRPRVERAVLRLRARRAHALRSQPAHRRPDGSLELDLRATAVRLALRALSVPRRFRARRANALQRCSPKPRAPSGITPRRGATVARRGSPDDVGGRPRVSSGCATRRRAVLRLDQLHRPAPSDGCPRRRGAIGTRPPTCSRSCRRSTRTSSRTSRRCTRSCRRECAIRRCRGRTRAVPR